MLLSFIDNPPIPLGMKVAFWQEIGVDGKELLIEGIVAFYDKDLTWDDEELDVVIIFPANTKHSNIFDELSESAISFFIDKTLPEDRSRMLTLLENNQGCYYTWACSEKMLTSIKSLKEIVKNLEDEISS